MTVNQGYGTSDEVEYYADEPFDIEHRESNPWPSQPLPVVSAVQEEAPQYGSCMTWSIPAVGTGQPVQIAQRRIRREKCKLQIISLPTTLTTITAPAVPATGVAQQNTSAFPVQVVISPNGATISAVTVNGVIVGTAAGTYNVPAFGSIAVSYTVATPTWVWQTIGSGSIVINSKLDPLQGASPQGATYSVLNTQFLEWDSQQPIYAIAIGGIATISVVDEAYADR